MNRHANAPRLSRQSLRDPSAVTFEDENTRDLASQRFTIVPRYRKPVMDRSHQTSTVDLQGDRGYDIGEATTDQRSEISGEPKRCTGTV
jgi:hypothetical protein